MMSQIEAAIIFPAIMPWGTRYVFHQNDDIFKGVRRRQAHSLVKVVVIEVEVEECDSYPDPKPYDRVLLEEGADDGYGASLKDHACQEGRGELSCQL